MARDVTAKPWSSLILPTVLMAFCAYYYYEVSGLPRREINLLLIRPVFVVILISYLALVVAEIRRIRSSGREAIAARPSNGFAAPASRRKLAFAALMLLYLAAMGKIGIEISTILFLASGMAVLGERNVRTLAVYSLVVGLLVSYVFAGLLSLQVTSLFFQ